MMNNAKDIFNSIVAKITLDEPCDEIKSIAYRTLYALSAITKTDIVGGKLMKTDIDRDTIDSIISRINKHEPIQYILGEQEYYGRSFFVTPDVLIPRAETEDLIEEVIAHIKKRKDSPVHILDIGVGSGCIPITLALEIGALKTYALDNSKAALAIARRNAQHYGVDIRLYLCDILIDPLPPIGIDIVVSNPPYVCHAEKANMKLTVLDYEPHGALFVPNDDPLCFYKAIASKSKLSLKRGGIVVVEINELFGKEVAILFRHEGYHSVSVIKDSRGKERVVSAVYDGATLSHSTSNAML